MNIGKMNLTSDFISKQLMPYIKRCIANKVPRSDKDDILQEVLLRLVKNMHRIENSDIFSYVGKIADNVIYDSYKKKTMATLVTDVEQKVEDIERQEGLDTLHRMVAYLDTSHRTIIRMYYFEGKKTSEISRLLRKPIGSVQRELMEGRDQLREMLDV